MFFCACMETENRLYGGWLPHRREWGNQRRGESSGGAVLRSRRGHVRYARRRSSTAPHRAAPHLWRARVLAAHFSAGLLHTVPYAACKLLLGEGEGPKCTQLSPLVGKFQVVPTHGLRMRFPGPAPDWLSGSRRCQSVSPNTDRRGCRRNTAVQCVACRP